MKENPELSIAIPFYNEDENVEVVIQEIVSVLGKNGINYEIVAVNNGSTDSTMKIIEKMANYNKKIKVVNVEKNIGYGNGIIKGLEASSGKYVGYCWGDNEVKPSKIVEMYRKMLKDDIDVCKATRTVKNYTVKRKILSFFYNSLFRMLFGLKIRDINGCPKIMKKSVYDKIRPQYKDWFIDAEIIIRSHNYGFKVDEVMVTYEKRRKGKSNVKFSTSFEFIKNAIKFKLKR